MNDNTATRSFQFSQLRFELEAVDAVMLPGCKGTTFRKVLAKAFKQIACALKRGECGDCPLSSRCVYAYMFEAQTTEKPRVTEKKRAIPHPFILSPPVEEKLYYKPGDRFIFLLTLIGKAAEYIPYFIYTFSEIGGRGVGKGRGRFKVHRVVDPRSGTDIYNTSEKIIRSTGKKTLWADITENALDFKRQTLTLSFSTPTRIKYRGSFVQNLEFHLLMRNLLQRISELSYFHCGHELSFDFKHLTNKATDVNVNATRLCWKKWGYSDAKKSMMKLEGFTGEITFKGDFEEFLPFIMLGQYIHVGKGTSFGLGRYEIVL